MATQQNDLALAFLQSQPGPAARILEQQPLESVAAFLKEVPPKRAAPVLAKMLPQYTARLLEEVGPEISAGFLLEMELNLVAAILRYSDQDDRRQMLGLLPEKASIGCRLLLHYSQESVGAWMMTQISILPGDCTVEEALAMLVRSRSAAAALRPLRGKIEWEGDLDAMRRDK